MSTRDDKNAALYEASTRTFVLASALGAVFSLSITALVASLVLPVVGYSPTFLEVFVVWGSVEWAVAGAAAAAYSVAHKATRAQVCCVVYLLCVLVGAVLL